MQSRDPHALLTDLFHAGIDAVHPLRLIPQTVSIDQNTLRIQPQGEAAHTSTFALSGRLFLAGAGKGAGPMAEALLPIVEDRIAGGCIIIPSEQTFSFPSITVMRGEHPLPGPGSIAGTQTVLDSLTQLHSHDCMLFCLTGGASSLLVSPATGLTLADKTATNQVLLQCGADIQAMNTVRKHMSQVKGGWLARHAQPATVISLILSDVIGDDVSVIGSGPTVPDPTTFSDAWKVVEQYDIETQLPQTVRTHLQRGLAGVVPETPKPGEPVFSDVHNLLIGSNSIALQAIQRAAERRGLRTQLVAEPLVGDTTKAGRVFAQLLRTIRQNCAGPTCILAGGETTVHVRGKGKGGRNQEFALVVAQELAGQTGWSLLSAGTDGIDGPTDAAGAFVDGQTIARARQKDLDADRYLHNNDTYTFFSALGDLFRPGSTGTNVMDIKIARVYPPNAGAYRSRQEEGVA